MGSRALWAGVACWGLNWPVARDGRFHHVDALGRAYDQTPIQWVDIWARWDALFYLDIARHGYGDGGYRVAFFPLYPLLIAGVSRATGLEALWAGLLVANVCDLVGWALFARLAEVRLGSTRAKAAVLLFAVYPSRNFGFSAYSEGPYLALAVAAFLLFERQRWWGAGLAAALVSATRPQGLLVGVALGADALRTSLKTRRAGPAAALMLAPVGVLAYAGYLAHQFGRPLYFVEIQAAWQRQHGLPWCALLSHGEWVDHLAQLGALALAVHMGRRGAPWRDLVLVALGILVPMSTCSVKSMGRFVGVLFPLFIYAAGAGRNRRWWWAYGGVALAATAVLAFKLGQGAKVI